MFYESNANQAGLDRDKEFEDKCANNSLDIIKGTKGTFRLYTQEGIICLATAGAGFKWEYQQQSQFWILTQINNTLFGKKVYKCVNVWWFAPRWIVEKIPPGVYHVYIRQGNSNVDPMCQFSHYKGVGFEEQFIDVSLQKCQIPFRQNQNRLINTYAATLDLSQAEGLTDIEIQLFRKDIQVYNYLVEGSILVPVESLEQPPNFYLKLKADVDLIDMDWNLKVKDIKIVSPIIQQGNNEETDPDRQGTTKLDDIYAQESDQYLVERLKSTYTQIWDKYDINRNGYLDKSEFRSCLIYLFETIKYPIDDYKIDQYFKKSDTYQSGQLTKQQIHWLLEQIVAIQVKQEEQKKKQEKIQKQEEELQAQNDNAKKLQEEFENGKIAIQGTLIVKSKGKSLPDNEHAVENLIKSEGKWRIEECDQAIIILNFEEEIEFMVIGIKSADDCPKMDPEMIEISIQKGDSYEVVASKDNLQFDERFQNRLFKPNELGLKTKSIKIDLQSVSNEGLQLSEILLFNKAT
ncbi:UNKNOWN [Stylonychia lemnae]|uniref:EF-hand domain-containing protein n=1 Tax=Stylonychia lemnae TaxID=5949 RepID=A0A078A8P6_STYLE|nr:UNKNOWN [Stylonychia lemnae]|eukprot:CDW77166.1 UNKNOWN [Stylonychia lemnae]